MRAIFLHAFGASRLTWAGTVSAIRGVDAIAPDLPGHGNSIGDLGDGSLEDLASRLTARIEDGPPAWLVGHSLGGGLALKLAAETPERFRGLVLLAPIGLGRGLDRISLTSYSGLRDKDEMRRFLEGLVANKGLIGPLFIDTALEHLERDGARDALARIANQFPTMKTEISSLLPRVADCGLDITVIWGTEDNIASPDLERIEKLGTLVVLPGIGHIPHVEAQKQVNALLEDKMAGGKS